MFALPSVLRGLPTWVTFWAICFAIFFVLKVVIWFREGGRVGDLTNFLKFAGLTVGMDPRPFLPHQEVNARTVTPQPREWLQGARNLAAGAICLWLIGPQLPRDSVLLRGWLGMTGFALLLHFGLATLLSLWWRSRGFAVGPIMLAPITARSLGDFWGARWNLAFTFLAERLILRPLARRTGTLPATAVVFLVSGFIHDAALSVAARGGFGRPTLYFMIQLAGVLLQRRLRGRRRNVSGVLDWLVTAVFVLGPAGLLFHRPFLERVWLPFLDVVGAAPVSDIV